MTNLTVTVCEAVGSAHRYQAQIGARLVFWSTGLEDLNRHLRDFATSGLLDWAAAEPSGYQVCDMNGCLYAASRLVVRAEPDRWILQMACGAHEAHFAGAGPFEVLVEPEFGRETADLLVRSGVRAFPRTDRSWQAIRLITGLHMFGPEIAG